MMDHDENPLYAHFARELKRLRSKRGWSQEALGKRIGYSDAQVSHVEGGLHGRARSSRTRSTGTRSQSWTARSPLCSKRPRILTTRTGPGSEELSKPSSGRT